MPPTIIQRIDQLRKQAQWMLWLRALAYFAAIAITAAMLVAMLDYFLRIEDLGTRIILSALFIASLVAAAWYFLLPQLKTRLSRNQVALMLEGSFPILKDRLTSSLAFVGGNAEAHSNASQHGSKHASQEPQAPSEPLGSKVLMRNLVAQTTSDMESLALNEAFDYGPLFKAVGCAAAAWVLAVILLASNPRIGSLALARMMAPWANKPWPRMNRLRFLDAPKQVARGGDVRFVVQDQSRRPPNRVEFEWEHVDGRRTKDIANMSRVGEEFVFVVSNVVRDFRFRALGGDDATMSWQQLKVVDPPQIQNGTTWLHPPEYTGWEPIQIEQSLGELRVLEGTHVVLSGQANTDLSRAELVVRGDGETVSIVGTIDGANAAKYSVPAEGQLWQIEDPGEYGIVLSGRDATNAVAPELWNVRVVRDLPPNITLVDLDGEEWITRNALVDLNCQVHDDLRVRRVEMRFVRSDASESGETTTELFRGPDRLESVQVNKDLRVDPHTVSPDYAWSIAEMAVEPGVILTYSLLAEDYKLQQSQSPARKLIVLSEQDLVDRIARRHSVVLARLRDRVQRQIRSKQQVESVLEKFRATGEVAKATLDRLQSALIGQQNVNESLSGPSADMIVELDRLKRTLARSRLQEDKAMVTVMRSLGELNHIAVSDLDPALNQISLALNQVQASVDQKEKLDLAAPQRTLGNAVVHQQSAIAALEKLLNDMSSWDNYRRLAQDVNEILRQQNEVREQTREVAQQALSRGTSELDGELRAALRTTAALQQDLARRTTQALEGLEAAREKLSKKDPTSEQSVRDALDAARDSAVAGRMRQAGKMIDQNRLGLAAKEQAAAKQALEQMLDRLSRRSYSPQETQERIAESNRQLERLQNRQRELSQSYRNAQKISSSKARQRELERLARRQQEQIAEMQKLARQLKRLRSHDASEQMKQAGNSAGSAGSAAKQGSAQEAEEKSRLAERQMNQAKKNLGQQQEQLRSRLVQEQMAKLPQHIEALLARHQHIVDEIRRLDKARLESSEWTNGMRESVAIAAETERAISTDCAKRGDALSRLPAFQFTLDELAISMLEVAEQLEAEQTSKRTQRIAEEIQLALVAVLEAVQAKKSSGADDAGGGGSGGAGGPQPNGEDFSAPLAQLKLLRQVQLQINQETDRLRGLRAGDSSAQRNIDRMLQRLTDRQDKVAKLASQLFQPSADGPPQATPQPEPGGDGLDQLDQELDQELDEQLR